MKLLITGAEQGLGKEIASIGEFEEVYNIPGHGILNAIREENLKLYMDLQVEIMRFKPDVVINNYGINHLSWIGETEAIDGRIITANVMSAYWLVNALKKNNLGPCTVLNISSVSGKIPMRCTTLYCTSKAALIHLTKCMARELAPSGWVVNCFAPGKIKDTEMGRLTDEQVEELRGWDPETVQDTQLDAIPMRRYLDLNEAAHIAVGILKMTPYVNGETITASGGV